MDQIANTNNLHRFLLSSVRDELVAYAKRITTGYEDDQVLLNIMFRNHRYIDGKHVGLRLSDIGHRLLSTVFQSYTYAIQDNIRNMNHALVVLDRNMRWPYHLSRSEISFYNPEDASWYALSGGIKEYAETMQTEQESLRYAKHQNQRPHFS